MLQSIEIYITITEFNSTCMNSKHLCLDCNLLRPCNIYFFKYFFGVPHLATCIFLVFYNEPELGVGIDHGMALTPFPSSIGIEPTTF